MPKNRIENLADGVFAILVTILTLDLKVPSFQEIRSDEEFLHILSEFGFILLIYFISFAVLSSYWLSHHFIISVFAKNADRLLSHFNLLFLSTVSLIPFSSYLLGLYPGNKISVFIFAANVIVIGLSLILLRWHVNKSREIENKELSQSEFTKSLIHLSLPPVFAVFAIFFAFISPEWALVFFVIPTLLNIIPNSFEIMLKLMRKLVSMFTRGHEKRPFNIGRENKKV